MSKPMIHARSSVKKFGGTVEDYIEIHDFLDSSKAVFPDNRHRALTHNSWFIFVCERVFGHEITIEFECPKCHGSKWVDGDPCRRMCMQCNDYGKKSKPVSVRDVCEQHILEDFGGKFIPTPADYLEGMEFHDWMNNGIKGAPTSHRKIVDARRRRRPVAPEDLIADVKPPQGTPRGQESDDPLDLEPLGPTHDRDHLNFLLD